MANLSLCILDGIGYNEPIIFESFNQRVQEFAVHSAEDAERVKREGLDKVWAEAGLCKHGQLHTRSSKG